ncbi:MAG: T9SS type A sorting domain-containing protein [Bacteroidales bacterium]|jgi:hypothetical protein|nr:T9SS type A sorting domain-containing protein [Bacteroidales bacterium]
MSPSFHIIATLGEQFTVDWGDGTVETFTGNGYPGAQSISHYLQNPVFCPANIVITGCTTDCIFSYLWASLVNKFDASEAPSITYIDLSNITHDYMILSYLNLSNCSLLEFLSIDYCSLKDIDIQDCISLKTIHLTRNKLSVLDISSTVAEWCHAAYNCLPLSQLYPITSKLPHPEWSYNYKQLVATQNTTINKPVDFSSEKEFGGRATFFLPLYGSGPQIPALESDYTINDGFITFHTARPYKVYMENQNIIGADGVYTFTPVNVVAPVQEIINVPTTAIATIPLTLTGTVMPIDASFKIITWSIEDAGTTGATITSNKLYTTAEGYVIVTATIKNGLGIDSIYIQNFTIEVKPVGINDPTQELSNITIYPNPTNGELEIEYKNLLINKIEVFDIKGKIVLSSLFNILSAHHRINISNLNSGNYFVKVFTTQGEIVKKVVKL